jgi:hypothetical protein
MNALSQILVNNIFFKICDIETNLLDEYPANRYRNNKKISLHRYGNGPFCKFIVPNNRKQSGIYAIYVSSKLKYVGECTNLSKRFNSGYGNISPRNCYIGGQSTNCRINKNILDSIKDNLKVELFFHESKQYKKLEKEIIKILNPEWNIRKK